MEILVKELFIVPANFWKGKLDLWDTYLLPSLGGKNEGQSKREANSEKTNMYLLNWNFYRPASCFLK